MLKLSLRLSFLSYISYVLHMYFSRFLFLCNLLCNVLTHLHSYKHTHTHGLFLLYLKKKEIWFVSFAAESQSTHYTDVIANFTTPEGTTVREFENATSLTANDGDSSSVNAANQTLNVTPPSDLGRSNRFRCLQ